MFAVFFFLALYMQNILGYSPLETGVRFLPSTLVIMVAGPVAGRLADRIGPRIPLVIGLLFVTASLAWQSRIEVDTSFAFLVTPFILLGLGMGFTMSPMSTAAMNAVDRTKAGVASGTLEHDPHGRRHVRRRRARRAGRRGRPPRPRAVAPARPGGRARASSSTRSAPAPRPNVPGQVKAATQQAFVDALGTGLTIAAIATLLAAVAAWLLVDGSRPQHEPAAGARARGCHGLARARPHRRSTSR